MCKPLYQYLHAVLGIFFGDQAADCRTNQKDDTERFGSVAREWIPRTNHATSRSVFKHDPVTETLPSHNTYALVDLDQNLGSWSIHVLLHYACHMVSSGVLRQNHNGSFDLIGPIFPLKASAFGILGQRYHCT